MNQEDCDKADAEGRRDACRSGDRTPGVGQIPAVIATGFDAHLTSLQQVFYNPPKDEAGKAAYDRGWKDEFEQ